MLVFWTALALRNIIAKFGTDSYKNSNNLISKDFKQIVPIEYAPPISSENFLLTVLNKVDLTKSKMITKTAVFSIDNFN